MTLLAAWLLSVGVADGVTPSLNGPPSRRHVLLGTFSGAGSALLLLALCGTGPERLFSSPAASDCCWPSGCGPPDGRSTAAGALAGPSG